jgi:phosphatidylglycerol:prolipoprotein diacylglycerol transferase
MDIVRIWDGGMSFHGGFLGVALAVIIYCYANSIPLWSGADLIALSSPPGLFLGRVANFINAELWGKPTTAPWGVVFPGERAQNCSDVIGICARHPTQLYEALLEGFFLFLILLILSGFGGLKRPGLVTGAFLVFYGSSRFFIEYFRVPDPQFFSYSNPYGFAVHIGDYGITMGQLLSLPMIFIGLFLAAYSFQQRKEF